MNETPRTSLESDGGDSGSGGPSPTREVRLFLCYRRNDGAWYAEWLNQHLAEAEYPDVDGKPCRVRCYYDKAAPGVADWKSLHFPSLQASQALILVCTPGIATNLSKRGHPDWVYEELRWWIRHRRTAPIVIDGTGEGYRWLPAIVSRKWPDINRIELHREQAEAAVAGGDLDLADRIKERVIGAIRQSERAIVFEDLERFKGLTRRLAWALSSVLLLMLVAVFAGLEAYQSSRRAEAQRQSAVATL